MKKITLLAAAALVLCSGARAEDPPPAKPAPPAAPGKHENTVSPEAKAVFEKMAKTANCPIQKGLKDATGTISTDMPQLGAVSMKFTVKPSGVAVEADPNLEGPMAGAGRQLANAGERVLGFSLGLFHPSDGSEFDADVVKKEGKEFLSLTTYKDGVQQSQTDFTVDANGLIVAGNSTRTRPGRDGGKAREMKQETTYTWTKSGDSYRLDKIETTTPAGKNPLEITYADAGGYAFPVSWKSTTPLGPFDMKVGDLVVEGKKVEIKALATPKQPESPKAGDEGKKDGGEEK